MIPKLRLDALTDGVFAVAMTLLVIDLRLPESFDPRDDAELWHRLAELGPQLLIYVVSFYVLSLRWVGLVRLSPPGEEVSESYIRWALVHLLLITLVPFTTSLVGRYETLTPAIWLYACNTILVALVATRMISLAETKHDSAYLFEQRFGLSILIAASGLVLIISLVAPKWALLGYLANMLDDPARRLMRRRHKGTA